MPSLDLNNTQQKTKLLYRFIGIFLGLILLNILSYRYFTQIDLTRDKRYTTTPATKNMLQNLKGNFTVTIFLKGKKLPAAFKSLAITTEELLKTFNTQSHNKINYHFVDPTLDESALATLEKYHMSGIPVSISDEGGIQQRMVFPWALVTFHNEQGQPEREAPILLQESNSMVLSKTILLHSEMMLEYKLANTIFQLQKPSPDFVGYLLGNGEAIPPQIISLINNIGQAHFAMDTFNLQDNIGIPQHYKALIVNRPTQEFSEIDLFKIDQYIMNGGSVLFAIDAAKAAIDSFQHTETFMSEPLDTKINDILFPYGARVNNDLALDGSNNAGIPVSAQSELYPWPYFPILEGNNNFPATKNLNGVLARFPSSIDLNKNNESTIKKTALLTTSIYGKTINLPALVMYKSVLDEPNLATFNKKNVIVAALLEGKFVSPFLQHSSEALDAFIKDNKIDMKNQSKNNSKIVVISDADILLNEIKESGQPADMGSYRYAPNYKFDNGIFLQNILTYLVEENNLLQARTKSFENRILDPKRTASEKTKWQIIAIGLPTALVGLFALIYGFTRKKKYGKI
ncbi:MAG TPA: gliding motility-associated ABC transporter substrate-binding protein GldG [Edaphocola sp.]|nr:gliding motility-associated ABC transporter substrate-binding protein GldG [Edaphocola sp.]